jgi:nicotinate phosphoribosyltransferase
LWQAQLLESPLLNLLNFQTLIATKAARICRAAAPDPVIEFGMRRAQGVDGAVSASRAAYIGGCAATSHLLAGKLFNIPVRGTHAHSWVMAFPTESEAFARFGEALPVDCTFLIDTYDSVEGARRACKVAKAHPEIRFAGVRLDSGDLARLSRAVRKVLDEEGFSQAKIMASNELDEYLIRDLKHQGAKIDVWGVGTHLVTAKGQSALDGIYKLSAIEDESGQLAPKLKVSEQVVKTTNPGVLQVRRFASGCDLIFDETLGCGSGKMPFAEAPERRLAPSGPFRDLLIPIFRQGRRVYTSHSLIEMQEEAKRQLDALPIEMTRLTNPEPYPVLLDRALYERKRALIEEVS